MSGQSYRAQDVLRRKYDNIKKRVKRKYSEEKCYSLGTGGGPPRNTTFSDVYISIKEILGTRIEGNRSKLDDDFESTPMTDILFMDEDDTSFSVPRRNMVVSQIEIALQEEEEILRDERESLLENHTVSADVPSISTVITGNGTSNNNNWSHYTPKMLKNKKAQELQIKKSTDKQISAVSDRIAQWADAKSQLEESHSKFAQKEHELKLKLTQGKHDKEFELMTKLVQDKHDREVSIMEKEADDR